MKIQHIKLIKELALLRKGEGMAPFKLHDKPIIRAIVAHATATQTNSLTNNQMYNFLLTELSHLPKNDSLNALRNALGITSTDKKLSTRRAAFAASIHKHPDTVERYENEALKIVASHLYRRNDLFSRSTSANSESPQLYLQEIETQAKATRAITTLGLSAHLSLGDHGEDFLKTLEFSRRPYLNTAITMNLIPSPRGTALNSQPLFKVRARPFVSLSFLIKVTASSLWQQVSLTIFTSSLPQILPKTSNQLSPVPSSFLRAPSPTVKNSFDYTKLKPRKLHGSFSLSANPLFTSAGC